MKLINKKGFTLIELLAVIIIIAIVALITVPVMLNIIENSKKGTFEASAYGIVSAAENYYSNHFLKSKGEPFIETTFTFTDGKSEKGINTKGESVGTLNFKGKIPKEGFVTINKDGETKLDINDGKWQATKNYKDSKITIKELNHSQKPLMKARDRDPIEGTLYDVAFYNSLYKDDIISIEVVDHINIPDNAIEEWDVSVAGNGSVMAWVTTNSDDPSKYELFIGGKGGVAANPDSSLLFYEFPSVININLKSLYTDQVINMDGMFSSCNNLIQLDLSNFDTSNVTNMSGMFSDCNSLPSLDLSSFDTSQVTDMGNMFDSCSNLNTLNLNSFNTSQVTNMAAMFYSCSSLAELNVSGFDTSNVTDMSHMFNNCSSLTSLDLSSFPTDDNFPRCYFLCGCDKLIASGVNNPPLNKYINNCEC